MNGARVSLDRAKADRLRRLEQLYRERPIYFVTACTDARRELLATMDVHQRLVEFAEAGPGRGAWLGAFVLMPDHLHVFVALETAREGPSMQLGDWVRSLKNAMSKVLRTHGEPSPHWQKGFFDHVLRSDESYAEKWDYVRQNPVRAGLVRAAEEWPFWAEPFRLEREAD